MLNPRSLEILIAVAESGSFSEAAASLWCTQSAVSQQIQALERKIDGPVIVRGTKPAQLTEAGEVLVAHGREILSRLRDAEAEAATASRRVHRLRLASFATGSAILMQAALAQREHLSDGRIEMVIADPRASISGLAARTLDLALVFDYGEQTSTPPGVLALPVVTEPMLVAMSSAHWASSAKQLSLQNLAPESWVAGHSQMCRTALEAACGAAGFVPRVVHETDDYEAAMAVVATSRCVALVPQVVARQLPRGLRAVHLPGQLPTRSHRLAWSDSRNQLAPTEDLVADLRCLLAG